jgi:hypothetical protein
VSLAEKPSTALGQDAEVGGSRTSSGYAAPAIGEADEPLVAMVQHVAADDGAIEDVESWEQRGGAVTFRSHTSSSRGPGFHRQSRPGAVECLDLALLVDRKNNRHSKNF